ncbi:MAG: ATP-binding cassette domain-containing protein [Deltaproteobacteria bacterium]|nr:ATP-binding cassette domain-containing protein [Deltaproteobacteria bacterium]MBW2360616.1 ATP-binding cassette domain-containing protein [Deltaproteobacteria bacterium]
MISLSNLSKHFGDQTLFEGVSFRFNPGERYGIVGANGSGKSTLLKILAGEESASSGEVSVPRKARIGVLKQDHFEYEDERIIDVVMMGDAELWQAMVEKERILANAETAFDGDRYAVLEDLILMKDGYSLESRAGEILEGLGIPTEAHAQPLSTLSGGFKLRVLLAQVLAANPDVLLLDEPTNHLDILSIRWLEKFLEDFRGAALLVSHDHRFLDNVVTTIVDVDYASVKAYPGDYQHFVVAKRDDRERREKEIAKQEAKIKEHQAFVDRFRAKATKARQAQSKLKVISKIEIDQLPQSSRRYPRFRFDQRRPSGRQVLHVEGVAKAYGDNSVLEGVSLTVMRGERVAIIGPNGIGKSTLLKVIMDETPADAGDVQWGYETYPGYVAQDHREQIGSHRQTIESWLANFCPGESIGFVRGHLGAVLFSGDEAEKKLTALSGGEAARLIFARQVVEKPNVLLLDEPTNHLDLEAIEALVEGIRAYEGTLIFVSHDRWFVGELATRIVEITREGINDFHGSYEEYLERCGDDHLDAQAVLRKQRVAKREAKAPGEKPAQARPRKSAPDAKRRRKQLGEQLAKATAAVAETEARLGVINEKFCDPTFFQKTPRDEISTLEAEHSELSSQLTSRMQEWEGLERELAELPED